MAARPRSTILAALLTASVQPPSFAFADEPSPPSNAPVRVLASQAFEGSSVFGKSSLRSDGGAHAGRRGIALPAGETLAVTLVTGSWNRYVGGAPWAKVTLDSVERNLRSGWVLDDDAFWVNQFGHPYQGTWSFAAARSAGLGFWGSAPFTFGASVLWELAGETKRPALNDQVTTVVGGVVLGEILHRLSGALLAEGGGWREGLAAALSPMGAINRGAFGHEGAVAAPPSRWQLSLGTVAVDGMGTGRGAWEPLGYTGFSFVYGLPGSRGLELERPFDHFVLEAGYGAATDPVATLRARGLLTGRSFEDDTLRGLYGLYLSFDFDTPPGHQISTSALGFGGSARGDLGGGLELEGDAILSGVLLGAGSRVDGGPGAGDRDYRFGPGQQGYLGLRLVFGSRALAGVALRQYLLLGAGQDAGSTELLVEASANALVRIAGPHGVGAEVSRHERKASADAAPTMEESASVVRVYYTLLGGARAR